MVLPQSRDGFTHRPNRPWSMAPRFWGPAQFLPMTTQYWLKICETAQRHNFTIYLEKSGNSNVYSGPLYEYSSNMTILCIWAWERCRPSLWKWLQIKNEKEKRYLIDVQFSTIGQDRQRNRARPPEEKQYFQYWILHLLVFTRFRANRDCLLKLHVNQISKNSFLWALLGIRVYIGLTSYG